ncbi:MAG: hypothetical protein RSF67_02710 [Clostridia bacterium]
MIQQQILIHQQNIDNWNSKAKELLDKANLMTMNYSISADEMIETIDRALDILDDVKFEECLLKELLQEVDVIEK